MPSAHEVPYTSIVSAAHKPAAAHPVVINPVKPVLCAARNFLIAGRIEVDFDIPFVLSPSMRFPPISRSPPGPRRRDNISAGAAKTNTEGTSFPRLHVCQEFRPEHSE